MLAEKSMLNMAYFQSQQVINLFLFNKYGYLANFK
jgi:hypothetical protein